MTPFERIRRLFSLRWLQSSTARSLAWEGHLHRGIGALQEGRFDDARREYERALALAESFPERDPRISVTLDNLAALYRLQGRYELAEPICVRALAIKEAALGPWHPNVASTLRDLTEIYRELGKQDMAKRSHDRAMKILERAIGPDFEELTEALDKSPVLDRSDENQDKNR